MALPKNKTTRKEIVRNKRRPPMFRILAQLSVVSAILDKQIKKSKRSVLLLQRKKNGFLWPSSSTLDSYKNKKMIRPYMDSSELKPSRIEIKDSTHF
ncbi:unnamed protein product [Rhizopus stolonifer]